MSKSVYTTGAEDGLILGPVMSAVALLCGATSYHPWMSVPALIAVVAVPTIAYLLLARTFRNDRSMTFSALWLQGICMFFFGGLIMAACVFVSLRWWVPDFLSHQIEMLITVYSSINDPNARQVIDMLEKVRSAGALPGPLDVALEMLYFSVFTGSILSVFYSLIIRNIGQKRNPYLTK